MLSALVCRSSCPDSGAWVGVGVGVGELFTKTYIYVMSYSDSGAWVRVGVGELFTETFIYYVLF